MTTEELFDEIWKWQSETFDTTSADAVNGLIKEAEELKESLLGFDSVNDLIEMADVFQYLVYIIKKRGYTFENFKGAVSYKLEINKARNWKLRDDGCYQHTT